MYSKEDILKKEHRSPQKQKKHAQKVKEYAKNNNAKDLAFSSSSIYIWQSIIKGVECTDMSKLACEFRTEFGTLADTVKKLPRAESVCIMCFGHYTKACGDFLDGGEDTEEGRLCLESNLSAIELSPDVQEKYYELNKNSTFKQQYGPKILYLPDVVIYDTPKDHYADVMLFEVPFVSKSENAKVRTNKDIGASLSHRLDVVLSIAAQQKAKIIVCGALGCNENGNDMWSSYQLFRDLIEGKYSRTFDKVIFTMQDGMNYLQVMEGLRQEKAVKVSEEKNAENVSVGENDGSEEG